MNSSTIKQEIAKLPSLPGVYFFKDAKNKILYIGKATNLKSRVQSYFRYDANPQIDANPRIANVQGRSEWISLMVSQVESIEFEQTDSVLEALILESNLIKKHQPKYNTLEKDDKSFSYFVITKEEFPKVLIVRKTDLHKYDANPRINANPQIANKKIQKEKRSSELFGNWKLEIGNSGIYGPYTSKLQMQTALKIIRKIFPFHSGRQKTEKGCLDFQIGMCPGPYAGAISKTDYAKNIGAIKMILEGKKKSLIKTLEKEMQAFAKKNEFEKAAEKRNKIFALNHIRDIALMSRDFESDEFSKKLTPNKLRPARIEAYDISNISGQHAVGSMVVFENGFANKSQYRKFKIKTVDGSNDVAMMREVLLRRFKNDWAMPDLVLLDGGLGHLNMAQKLLHEELGLFVNIVSVAKGPTRKKLDIRVAPIRNTKYEIRDTIEIVSENINVNIDKILKNDLLIKQVMDEAHRFAITYHRKLRKKNSLH